MNRHFKFRGFKQKYHSIIDMYFKTNKCEFFPPFDGPGLLKLTHIVALTKLAVKRGELVCSNLSHLLATYDVIVVDGLYKLIKKLKLPTDKIKYYVSCEDAYNLIFDAHMKTNHGGLERIMKILNSKYCVSKMAVELFLSLCNVCKANGICGKGLEKEKKSKDLWQIAISVMHETDEPFGYILFVVDSATGFVHLRPLISRDTMTVAIELLKIYGDFGMPLLIETNTKFFFQGVVTYMKKLNPDYISSVIYSPIDLSELNFRVGKYLGEWQHMTKSKNWTFGVHVVQWRLNNLQDFTMNTQFENLFYRLPNCPLTVNNNEPDLSHNAQKLEITYKHVAIQLIDTEDLDKNILVPDVTPVIDEESFNLENLEDSIQGNIIVKSISAATPNHPTIPYSFSTALRHHYTDSNFQENQGNLLAASSVVEAHNSKQPFQISNFVTMSVAKKTHPINPNIQVVPYQQTEKLRTDVEIMNKLQEELSQCVQHSDGPVRTVEVTSNKVQTSEDYYEMALSTIKETLNRSIVEQTLKKPDTSILFLPSTGHISNKNEETKFINENDGKITLLSVEIEEDYD